MPYPLPLPIPTVTITTVTTNPLPFLNPEAFLGLPSNSNFLPTNFPTTTTGSLPLPTLMPASPSPPAINAHAKDGSINYYSPNYSQPTLPHIPAPPVALPPCAPPAPSTPTTAAPRKCGNCGTTESCIWRNVKSKESIRCHKCYGYRQRTKKERPAAVIKANRVIKMKRI
ncbi:hypothetical protein CAEBREN_00230 [Caenorhabditis brenneri]|uniref:GATA-type domain-containing protein n=1 Tax=Caenorhabditis brenneri TaxID=135651 RepID=G0MME0_CAEBE|nr:hypothetical protein CAEBREN_00230 [Caenorhabditis brenneri]